MSNTLINFNVPVDLKQRFDTVCYASFRTRSSVLVELMTGYIVSQGRALIALQADYDEVDRILHYNPDLEEALFGMAGEVIPPCLGVSGRSQSNYDPEDPELGYRAYEW